MFSYKDVAVAQPGTHTSIWPELENLTAATSNEKSMEPVTSEKLLPKKQTSTPMMSDSEKSGKISPEEAEVSVSKEVTADATTPMTTDLTVAQPSLDDTSETHIAIIASSYTTAAAPLIVEVSDTNVSPTNDDSETCSLHESVEEPVVAAAAVSNKRASVEMRENADAEDEVKDSMAHDKHAAAIDDCKSSDDNEMLSAEASSCNHDNVPGLVPTTVAMTPFKDGKGSTQWASSESTSTVQQRYKHGCGDTNPHIPTTFGTSNPGEIHHGTSRPTVYHASPTRHAHIHTSSPFWIANA
jgi:hypothetical protein